MLKFEIVNGVVRGYAPSDINWDLTVEFYDDPED